MRAYELYKTNPRKPQITLRYLTELAQNICSSTNGSEGAECYRSKRDTAGSNDMFGECYHGSYQQTVTCFRVARDRRISLFIFRRRLSTTGPLRSKLNVRYWAFLDLKSSLGNERLSEGSIRRWFGGSDGCRFATENSMRSFRS